MTTPIPPEPTTPYPPLLPWLRRLGYAMSAMILLLLVVRLIWGLYTQHALDATLADVQRRGYPITEEQLVASVPQSADDAAPLLRRAAAAIAAEPPHVNLPISVMDADQIDALSSGSPGPLDFLHQAARFKAARWDIRLDPKPFHNFRDLRTLTRLRSLAWLARDVALLEHQRHRDDLAIMQLSDLLQLARLCDQSRHLIGHLVAISVNDYCTGSAIQLASELEFAERGSNTEKPASRGMVNVLTAALNDEETVRTGVVQCWNGERPSIIADVNALRWTWLFQPLGQLKIADGLREFDILQQACAAESWPAAHEKLKSITKQSDENAIDNLSTLAQAGYPPITERLVLIHFHALTDRRAAQVLLAMRIFQLDHAGRLPAKPADLCPTYLTQIPTDPFSKNQKPFGFVNDGKNPRIYSLGQNGIDDGGAIRHIEYGEIYRWQNQNTAVYTFYRKLK